MTARGERRGEGRVEQVFAFLFNRFVIVRFVGKEMNEKRAPPPPCLSSNKHKGCLDPHLKRRCHSHHHNHPQYIQQVFGIAKIYYDW